VSKFEFDCLPPKVRLQLAKAVEMWILRQQQKPTSFDFRFFPQATIQDRLEECL
jgi:hypothetical protein